MLYLLYSDDYEVCLGGNYRPETEVLVDTTARVLATCEQLQVPMTLFTDVACLWRYREFGGQAFVDAVEAQLQAAIGRGHDVQAHLHPHWLETQIEWDSAGHSHYTYSPRKFLLGGGGGEQPDDLFALTLSLGQRLRGYLQGLLRPVAPEYRCVAFRAGGYGLQPGMEQIVAALHQAGFRIDSSIVPGMKYNSNVNRIDFTSASDEGNYYLGGAAGYGLFEVPVVAGPVSRAAIAAHQSRKLVRKLLGRLRSRAVTPPVGYAAQQVDSGGGQPRSQLAARIGARLKEWARGWAMLELTEDPAYLWHITRSYVDRLGTTDGDLYFSFSCHSKSATQRSLQALQQYHRLVERRYGSRVQAIHFQDLDRRLSARRNAA
ncbi:MAG: hypothetical protein NTY19_24240 [Planctomycetota bacterium]|nr:hypothetical protein [Planctomycetota bacterium]